MDTDMNYVAFDPDTITRMIDALPEEMTSSELAAIVQVDARRLAQERARGCAPVPTGKRGAAFVYEREAVRGWITARLAAIEERLQIDAANVSELCSDYGGCHVSDYYIHGHAPYINPAVFAPEPETWPALV